MSDVVSLFTFLFAAVPVVLSFRTSSAVGLRRTITTLLLALGLVWIEFGIDRLDVTDFPPGSSVILLTAIFAQIALILQLRRKSQKFFALTFHVLRNAVYLFLLYTAVGFVFNFTHPAATDSRELVAFNADAGIVFGAAVWSGNQLGDRPSPALRGRIDVGYSLLTEKVIPRLVVTGASAPGEQTEASVARQEMVKRGVDPSAIITEEKSHSTFEQIQFIRSELMKKQSWSRFIVISDQYHLARVLEMCKFNGITAIGTPSQISQPFFDLLYYRMRESIALVAYWLLGK
jgi:vancomycin permeability regulator SanA